MDIDALVSALARAAAACDNGVVMHSGDEGKPESSAFHQGGAKAYRHAIQIVIECQRMSRALQRESEQKAS